MPQTVLIPGVREILSSKWVEVILSSSAQAIGCEDPARSINIEDVDCDTSSNQGGNLDQLIKIPMITCRATRAGAFEAEIIQQSSMLPNIGHNRLIKKHG